MVNLPAPMSSARLPERHLPKICAPRGLYLRGPLRWGRAGAGERDDRPETSGRFPDIDQVSLGRDLREALHKDLAFGWRLKLSRPVRLAEYTRMGREGKVRRLLDLRKTRQ